MPPTTERGGVTFNEKEPIDFEFICHIETNLNSGFGQDHLKSLRDVKEKMAVLAKDMGGSYIANFTYGQRNGSVIQQLWSIDNVLWFGAGDVGKMNKLNEN